MVERVTAKAGYVDIFEAVVVVVAHGHPHIVVVLRHPGEAGLFRDIGKRAIGILMIEPIPELAVGLVRQLVIRHGIVDLGAIREEDIEAAVVVVIEESYAAAHGFYQVLVRGGGAFVLEIDLDGLGNVGKLHVRRGCGAHQAEEQSACNNPAAYMSESLHDDELL